MKKYLILVFAVLISSEMVFGCKEEISEKKGGEKVADITGKKILMIIASQNFRDEELKDPKAIIEENGGEVTIASSSLEPARGMRGAVAKADILVKDVKVEDYDAVIFVGGMGASEYWNDATAHNIAKKANEAGKLVCAICIAPVTLANAGVLEGKKATVYSSEKRNLRGAKYTGASVEVDGNIITADGPDNLDIASISFLILSLAFSGYSTSFGLCNTFKAP